jgi:methyltransferase (TIGR00027 family)
MAPFRPIQGQVLSRARYAEDKLEEAIASGIGQYVIIGAGLDSFAWRRKDLSSSVQVFELDHPESQACKLRRLSKAGINTPQGLHFISIDFERQSLPETLSVLPFPREKPAFFSWLGVTYYLTEKTVMSTLSAISSFAAKGSQIVFDYGIHRELMGTSAIKSVKKVRRFTSRRREKLITTFDPNEFPARICELGFKLLENLSPSEQNARYFASRTDDLRNVPVTYYAHFEVKN